MPYVQVNWSRYVEVFYTFSDYGWDTHADNFGLLQADARAGVRELIEAGALEEVRIEGWRAPFDGVSATSPEVKLARRIQAEIKSLIERGTMTGRIGDRQHRHCPANRNHDVYGDRLCFGYFRHVKVRNSEPDRHLGPGAG